MLENAPSLKDFNSTLTGAIASHGWYVPCYHGIGGDWVVTNTAQFTAQMDALVAKSSQLWITAFKNAICYHKEKNSHQLKIMNEDENGWTLSFTDTLHNNAVYNQPLTIRMKKPSWSIISLQQGETILPFLTDGDTIMFNVTPNQGPILFIKTIVNSAEYHKADPAMSLYPNPTQNLL